MKVSRLYALDEPFAAGFFEVESSAPLRRLCRATLRFYERAPLPAYRFTPLYPEGEKLNLRKSYMMAPDYSLSFIAAPQARRASGAEEAQEKLRQYTDKIFRMTTRHLSGGAACSHAALNFARMIKEGADSLRARIESSPGSQEFKRAMKDALKALLLYRDRLVAQASLASPATAGQIAQQARLLRALKRAFVQPPEDFYQALVAWNLLYYFDDCDAAGPLDRELAAYPSADAEIPQLIGALLDNIEKNGGWPLTLGGSHQDGSPAYTRLTYALVRALPGRKRVFAHLRVRRDMPDDLWQAVCENYAAGCGQPALFSEENCSGALIRQFPELPASDLSRFAGGVGAQIVVEGLSNVGTPDAGLNLKELLEECMHAHLPAADSHEAFLNFFNAAVSRAVEEVVCEVNAAQQSRARYRPQPVRTLLIDDCVDKGREFQAGGARINYSIINVHALEETANALCFIRREVFQRRSVGGANLSDALRGFDEADRARERMYANPLSFRDGTEGLSGLMRLVHGELSRHTPWRGGRFVPAVLSGFEARGGDSEALAGASALPFFLFAGAASVRITAKKESFRSRDERKAFIGRVRAFFEKGGMHLEIRL